MNGGGAVATAKATAVGKSNQFFFSLRFALLLLLLSCREPMYVGQSIGLDVCRRWRWRRPSHWWHSVWYDSEKWVRHIVEWANALLQIHFISTTHTHTHMGFVLCFSCPNANQISLRFDVDHEYILEKVKHAIRLCFFFSFIYNCYLNGESRKPFYLNEIFAQAHRIFFDTWHGIHIK